MQRRSQSGGIIGILMGLMALAAMGFACLVLFGLYVAHNIRVEHTAKRLRRHGPAGDAGGIDEGPLA